MMKQHDIERGVFFGAVGAVLMVLMGLLVCVPGQNAIAADLQAEDAPTALLTAEECAWLKEHPAITLGGGISFEPFVMYDNHGKVIGYDVDIASLVAERTGLNIRFELGKWDEIQERARKRELDGLSTANVTKEREKYYNASRSLIHLTPLVIVKKGNPTGIHSPGDIVGKRVVLQKGNALKDVLTEQTKEFEAIYVESLHDVIKAIVSEKADCTIFEESVFYIAHQIGLENMIEAPFTIGAGMDFHFLLRNDRPLLQSIIDKGIKSISVQEKLEIRRRWFAYPSAVRVEEERIPLTDGEQAWIKAHPEIRLGVDPAWQPMEFIDRKGRHRGISSDYVRILNRRLGINMKVLPDMSWTQLIEAMPQRGVDVFSSVVKTPEREKYLSHTDPYLPIDWVVVRPLDAPKISGLADFEGRTVAAIEGYVTLNFIAEQYPEIHILPGTTTLDVLQSVVEGKADAALVERITASMTMHGHRMYSLEIDQHVIQSDRPLSLAVRNDWPELVPILNKGLASITQEEREVIEQKWMAVPIHIGYTTMDVLRIILYVIAVMGTFLGFFLFWNRRLKNEVRKRIEAEKERVKAEEKHRESNEQYRLLMENSPDSIMVQEVDGTFRFVSQQSIEVLGVAPDVVCTMNIFEHIHAEDVERAQTAFRKAAAGNKIRNFTYRFIDPDGEIRWLDHTASPLIVDGKFSGIQSTVRNITKRKKAEEELRESESKYKASFMEAQRFRDTLDKVPSYIYMKDIHSRYIYANQLTLNLFKCSAEELIGRDDGGFFPPDTVKNLQEIDSRVFNGETTNEEIAALDEKGEGNYFLEIKSPIVEEPDGNKIVGLVGISTDITELKIVEAELEKHREHLEEQVEERTEKLRKTINLMAGRENRMAELKRAVRKLRTQLEEAGMTPVADDPLKSGSGPDPGHASIGDGGRR
jgi:PAS domain S-box-containing protein